MPDYENKISINSSLTNSQITSPKIETNEVSIDIEKITKISHDINDVSKNHIPSSFALANLANNLTEQVNQIDPNHIAFQDYSVVSLPLLDPNLTNLNNDFFRYGWENTADKNAWFTTNRFSENIIKINTKFIDHPGYYFLILNVTKIDSGKLEIFNEKNQLLKTIITTGEHKLEFYIDNSSIATIFFKASDMYLPNDMIIIKSINFHRVYDRIRQYLEHTIQMIGSGGEYATENYVNSAINNLKNQINDIADFTNIQEELTNHLTANNPHGITPDKINAAKKIHTHIPSEVGAAPLIHNHTADQCGAANIIHTHDANSFSNISQHNHTPDQCGAAPVTHSHTFEQLGITNIEELITHWPTPEELNAADRIHEHTVNEIGAAPVLHTHIPENCGAAPIDHTHDPIDIGASQLNHTHVLADIIDWVDPPSPEGDVINPEPEIVLPDASEITSGIVKVASVLEIENRSSDNVVVANKLPLIIKSEEGILTTEHITSSKIFKASETNMYTFIIIGAGGGGGGAGRNGKAGSGGGAGGFTKLTHPYGTIISRGGSGGGGGAPISLPLQLTGGGGGGAGENIEYTIELLKDEEVDIIIGSGGASGKTEFLNDSGIGLSGRASNGGQGEDSASFEGGQGGEGINLDLAGSFGGYINNIRTYGAGGNGGNNKTIYGGGGSGAGSIYGQADNGGSIGTEEEGGLGGNGAVIIKYYKKTTLSQTPVIFKYVDEKISAIENNFSSFIENQKITSFNDLVFYIDSNGNDTDIGNETFPWRTLKGAIKNISNYDVRNNNIIIKFFPGIYDDDETIISNYNLTGPLFITSKDLNDIAFIKTSIISEYGGIINLDSIHVAKIRAQRFGTINFNNLTISTLNTTTENIPIVASMYGNICGYGTLIINNDGYSVLRIEDHSCIKLGNPEFLMKFNNCIYNYTVLVNNQSSLIAINLDHEGFIDSQKFFGECNSSFITNGSGENSIPGSRNGVLTTGTKFI